MKPFNKIGTLLLLACLGHTAYSGETGYEITFLIKEAAGKKAVLSGFYGQQLQMIDSAFFDASGKLVFKGKSALEKGLYLLKWENKTVDFLFEEPKFTLQAQQPSLEKTAIVKGSEENRIYFDYKKFIIALKKEADSLRRVNAPILKEKLQQLNAKVVAHRNDLLIKHPNSLAVKVIRAGTEPKLNPLLPKPTDSLAFLRLTKEIQFQNLDLNDDRLIRTPYIEERVSNYLRLTPLNLDSLANACDHLLELSKGNQKVQKFVMDCMLGRFEKNDKPLLDLLYSYLAEKYYLPDRTMWADTSEMLTVKANVARMAPLLTGKVAPAIDFVDSSYRPLPLYAVKAKYTVVYFWDAECSHCQETTPKMFELYTRYKQKGLEVYAVTIQQVPYSWKDYIKQHHLTWINVWEPEKIAQVYATYQVGSTPAIYLLDEEKRILFKKVSLEELEKNLEKLTAQPNVHK